MKKKKKYPKAIVLPRTLANCSCRCNRHRREAKKLAWSVLWDFVSILRPDTDVETLLQYPDDQAISLETFIQINKACLCCTHIYLLLLGDLRGEIVPEAVLRKLYPLPQESRNKKLKKQ